MKLIRHLAMLLATSALLTCSGIAGGEDLNATSTDFFRYSYDANYYRSTRPYFELQLFPNGNNIAIGQFYEPNNGRSYAFNYQGPDDQLEKIEALLEKHGFFDLPWHSTSQVHIDHAPSYLLQITYKGRSHYVSWDRRQSDTKEHDTVMEPLIKELEDVLKIPQIIKQFELERQ